MEKTNIPVRDNPLKISCEAEDCVPHHKSGLTTHTLSLSNMYVWLPSQPHLCRLVSCDQKGATALGHFISSLNGLQH